MNIKLNNLLINDTLLPKFHYCIVIQNTYIITVKFAKLSETLSM